MDSRTNWLLLINAALGSFLAGTASRIFAVSMPTIASSLNTTIVGISWAVTLSGLSLLLVGVAQVMVGFVLPFYLQDILHLSPTFMGLLFISAPVFTVTLSPVAGWVADKIGPRLPSTAGILFLVIAAFIGGFLHADSHCTSAVIVLALWGLATAMFYPPNHAAMIGSVPAQHRGRGDRGHICPVWSWEHVWDFTGNVVTHRSISLLQWRSFGNADPGQSGHFRKRDEFYVLLDWNHGASGDRVLGHARNRETVSPNG